MGRSRVHVRRLACAAAALIVGYGAFPVPDAAPGRPVGACTSIRRRGGSPWGRPIRRRSRPRGSRRRSRRRPLRPPCQARAIRPRRRRRSTSWPRRPTTPGIPTSRPPTATMLAGSCPTAPAAAAATAAGAAAAAPAVRPSAAGRAGRRLAGRPGARAGARPGATRRSRAAAQKSKRRAARQAPPPRRGAGRVLSRVEDWLGGGRHVRRPYP
jgi:hypothetical protein